MKVHISTNREIGEKCIEWAKKKLPEGFELTDKDDCEIFISVLSEELVSEQFISSKIRCVNFHPGILPVARGAGLFSWSILNGDLEAGVTLHEIDPNIDSGPVIEVRKFPITPKDTAYSLYKRGEQVIFEMFQAWFFAILEGNYETIEQDEDRARIYYRKHLNKAKNLTRFIRAFYFPGKESAYYFNSRGEKRYMNYDD